MCRILVTDNIDFVETAAPTLRNGGPDKQILKSFDKIYYYHTRLSIQGLDERSDQPMFNNNLIMLFNGEIYNKKFLEDKFCKSKRFSSDTELIFFLLQKYDYKVIDFFEGMFSIVWKRKSKKELFIVRDIFGKKPLYIKESSNNWFISSEYDWFRQPDNSNDDLFKTFGFYPEPFTSISSVKCIPSGYVMNFSAQEGLTPLYKVSSYLDDLNIKDSLIADVPTVLAYSGGVDSSILSSLLDGLVDRISIGNLTKKKFKRHRVINLKKTEYIELKKEWKNNKGSNFSIDGFNIYVLSKLCKINNYKVVLTGVGGDELFSGYKQLKYMNILYLVSFFPNFMIKLFSSLGGRFNKLDWLLNYKLPRFMRCYLAVRSVVPQKNLKFKRSFINKINIIYNSKSNLLTRFGRSRIFANLEMHIFLKSRLLRDSDYNSMLNGIELRAPFLNKSLLKKINKTFPLNTIILPNKLGSVLMFKLWRLVLVPFYPKKGFFISYDEKSKKSLL